MASIAIRIWFFAGTHGDVNDIESQYRMRRTGRSHGAVRET
jgi:hypothetical protein